MIGVDVVQIDRIQKAAQRSSFLRVFTAGEMQHINGKNNPYQTMAGIFAAKEAAAKALGHGFSIGLPEKFEVFWDGDGCPFVRFNDKIINISISHDAGIAVAVAYFKQKNKNINIQTDLNNAVKEILDNQDN